MPDNTDRRPGIRAWASWPRGRAEHEVKPHKVRYYLEQRDPEFEPKMAEILCVYRQVAMLRADEEKSQSHDRGGASLAINGVGVVRDASYQPSDPDRPTRQGGR
jgi:hypothetical protein